jgi:hypothetical protein
MLWHPERLGDSVGASHAARVFDKKSPRFLDFASAPHLLRLMAARVTH